MRNWLIRKLGGIPLPKSACLYIQPDGMTLGANNQEAMIIALGVAPLPKAGEGQIVVGPVVRKLPVRKIKMTGAMSEQPLTITNAATGQPMSVGDFQAMMGTGAAPPSIGSTTAPLSPETTVARSDINLCDTCQASVQDCRNALKEVNKSNNTVKCDQHK